MTKRYLVVYAKVPNSNFAGMSPDIPGCISVGDTLENMRAMMREALELTLESLAECGDPIPEPHSTSVDFRDEAFEGVEYFVVEHLTVKVPNLIAAAPELSRAASAA